VRFRSPPSRIKTTSRRTTYSKIGMIQRWKREKSAGKQNCPVGVFPFVFQETSDDDFCQTDYVISNPSGQLVEECEKNNISKINMIQRWVPEIWLPEHYWFLPILHLSLAEFSIVSHTLFFYFLNWWFFAVLKAHFPLITFMSLIYIYIYIYIYYFIFNVNYPVCFCLNR